MTRKTPHTPRLTTHGQPAVCGAPGARLMASDGVSVGRAALRWAVIAVLATLTACGGGGGNDATPSTSPAPTPTSNSPEFVMGQFEPSSNFSNQCQTPRTGSQFSDSQGSTTDENFWLRSFSNELYLWYDEIVDANPADYDDPLTYFDLMRTTETTPSGAPKDQFHFTLNTADFIALSQSGISVSYGMDLALLRTTPPREIVVAFTEPNSPATDPAINLTRGVRILEVDGRDAVNGGTQEDVDALNAGLFPSTEGETHTFLIEDPSGGTREVVLSAQATVTDPVQNVRVESTANGEVGYLTFNTHIDTAEAELFDAMTQLEEASVTELVLDMRYNGGGLLLIANQLASMIAGPAAASGRVFEELQFNDKHTAFDPVTGAPLEPDFFASVTAGRGDSAAGRELPALNLSRVFVLAGPGTCSASESIINGLRGIGIEVILIGDTTCGKPYGFYPFDNCGTTYFSVQFRGVNAENFGDYADGFSPANLPTIEGVPLPGCAVADDFSQPLGSPLEARFAAALAYMNNGTCPAPSGSDGGRVIAATGGAERSAQTSASGLPLERPQGMPGGVRMRPY